MRRFAVLLIVCLAQHVASAPPEDHFFTHVVPIFQRRCIGCHNDSDPKGDLSLQSAQSFDVEDFIDCDDPIASRLLEIVQPVDGKAEMPKNADPLSPGEIAHLQKWVADGARWPTEVEIAEPAVDDFDWWSLKPLRRPEVPEVGQKEISRNPIDSFVRRRLRERGLSPSPEADRHTLIRRLHFDLLGLPPSPEEVQAFVDNNDPDAYETLVDRLLESEHYGERWARHWLDVVHYADTHGYDKDKLRPNAWPYRDYVIRSLNEDKPYSRFVLEQLAGDVLWPDTVDGITATGFIAAGPWDFIGHAEVPETKIDGRIARNLDRDDMVSSTMNTFVSTTVQCARCHNHKFDPVTQQHYYSLQSVFAALDRAERTYDADPELAIKRRELQTQLDDATTRKDKGEAEIRELGGDELKKARMRVELLEKRSKSGALEPAFGYHSQFSDRPDTEKWVQVDLGREEQVDRIELFPAHDDFGGIGPGFGFPIRYRVELSNDPEFTAAVTTPLVDRTEHDIDNPGTKPQVFRFEGTTRGRYVRVTATRLFHRKDTYIFALGELSVINFFGNVAEGKNVTASDSIEAPVRWQKNNLVDGYYYGRKGSDDLTEEIATAKRDRDDLIASLVPKNTRDSLREATEEIREINQELSQLPKPGRVYCGMVHTGRGAFKGTGANGGKPRTIHVLHRGDILQPRTRAEPGRFPVSPDDKWQFSLDSEHGEGDRRVALATWIVAPTNPLTWRSIVNRVWQYHFGRGIVETPNDFGRMGGKPTHPELLDWLAVEFRDGGQSLKQLHKLIAMSATYRQASHHNRENAEIDASNAWLWRSNRRRLSAEEVRDAVLTVSGKLDRKMYGPGMRLFELERTAHSPHYEYHKHDPNTASAHRRAIYRFIVRSQPDPFMTTLDCADSSQSVARRDETVTALQALSLMNNKFMLAMSEHFAARVEAEEKRTRPQILRAWKLATGRSPSKANQKALVAYSKQHGLENTCRLLFNLNEFVFVD